MCCVGKERHVCAIHCLHRNSDADPNPHDRRSSNTAGHFHLTAAACVSTESGSEEKKSLVMESVARASLIFNEAINV